LPEHDGDFPKRWQAIKMGFSRRISPGEPLSASRRIRGERGIWQRRYWEHTIRDDADLERHVDYIHYNPVKHGLVSRVSDWPHSSFHRYVERGILPADWGGDAMDMSGRFGE
jgi:putative transposase